MSKRNLATVLWFIAGWSGGGLVTGLLGLPSVLGLVPAVLAAGLVRWDPTGALWSRPTTRRRVVPINEFAASLGKDAAQSAPETDRVRV